MTEEIKTYRMARFHLPEGEYTIKQIEEILETIKEMKRQHDQMLSKAMQPIDEKEKNT
jgi:FPC/CPF motif-containing protein YcgG